MLKLRLLIANQIKESCHSFDWFKNYVIIKTKLTLRTGSNFHCVNIGLAFCILFPGLSYVFITLDARKKLNQEVLPVMLEHQWKVMSFCPEESKFGLFPQPQVPSSKFWVPLGETAPAKFSQIRRDLVAWEGAKIRGTFQLKERTRPKILISGNSSDAGDSPRGGGGGSFVVLLDRTPLIIAGGGGGGGTTRDQFTGGDPGQVTGDGAQRGIARED